MIVLCQRSSDQLKLTLLASLMLAGAATAHYGNEAQLNAVLFMLKLSHRFRDFSLVQPSSACVKLSHWDHFR